MVLEPLFKFPTIIMENISRSPIVLDGHLLPGCRSLYKPIQTFLVGVSVNLLACSLSDSSKSIISNRFSIFLFAVFLVIGIINHKLVPETILNFSLGFCSILFFIKISSSIPRALVYCDLLVLSSISNISLISR